MVKKKPPVKKVPKKTKREFELLGGTAVFTAAALVISIFLASSLDVVIIRSQQYASVVVATLTDLVNKERGDNRLGGLTISPTLTKAAQLKADDMAKRGYFAHVSPDGIDPWHWFDEAGYRFAYAGENLAVDFSDSDAVNTAWMNSPTHRANILDEHYTEIGIATSQGMYEGHPTTFVVQEFGKPLADAAPAQKITVVPTNPAVTATAKPAEPTKVLGESVVQASTQTQNTDTSQNAGPSMTVTYASPVERAIASPDLTLKYLYYGFAALVILALVVATGFELHVRHLKKAAGAGFLLALMLFLFLLGGKIVFVEPSVPTQASFAATAKSLQ